MPSKVAILRTTPERVLEDTARLMELAGVRESLDPGATTILKDNISWHLPYLSANTTPWQLEGTIRGLRAAGFDDLVGVHNDTVVTDPVKGERLNRLDDVWKALNVPELYNCRPEDMDWVGYRPKGTMLALGNIFPDEVPIPEFFIGKNVVHLPTMKCHVYTTTTGAMKNAFGGLTDTRRHYAHTWIHDTLVDLLTIQKEIHPGIFAVMDGTLAGNGAGPRTMTPVRKDVMLASADQVAIDAVAAKVMGFDPMSIRYIRRAHELGLGCGDTSQIEIAGEAGIAEEDWGFSVRQNFASTIGTAMWHGGLRPLQRLFFHTPLVNLFTYASYVYHDYLWWPLRGRAIQAEVRRETPWGQLFERYGDGPASASAGGMLG